MSHITTTLVESNYRASKTDHYIGVDSRKATIITLPISPDDGKIIIIKAEMRPPIGNRKITILTKDGSTIDGYSNYVIHVSNESVQMVYRGDGWHVI